MNQTDQDRYAVPIAIFAAGCLLWLIGAIGTSLEYISGETGQAMYIIGGVIALIGLVSGIITSGWWKKNHE